MKILIVYVSTKCIVFWIYYLTYHKGGYYERSLKVSVISFFLKKFIDYYVGQANIERRYQLQKLDTLYFIPIEIRAPLIFAHLACAKIKGSKFAQCECAKIKGGRKKWNDEWKNGKFTVK